MNIRVKLSVLLLLILSLVLAGILIQYEIEKRGLISLIQNEKVDKEANINRLLKLEGRLLETFAYDYTYWDEMVEFVNNSKNNPWASVEVDQPVLTSYKANAIWIYTKDSSLAYSLNNLNDINLKNIPIPKKAITKLLGKKRFCHFFINTDKGILEIRGATIHPSTDNERKTPPQGYFFVSRLLDKKYITELSELTNGKVEITQYPDNDNLALSQKKNIITFTKALNAWDNNPIGYINIEFESNLLPIANNIFRNELILFALFCVIFATFIFVTLSYYVVNPLQLLSKSLKTKDITYVSKIQKKRDEFGELARLILDFFKVNEELQQEIIERKRVEEERKKLEERVARQEKMESLGRLAGGVAHDLNNILTGMVTYPDYLLWTIPDTPENKKVRDVINTVKESGERASAIVSDLLTMTRSSTAEMKPLDLNKLVEDYKKSPEYIELMNRYPRITFETLLDRDLYNILGSSHMIHKALMNLVINAAEAMPNGGKITVSTENRYVDKAINGYDSIYEGNYVVLSVADQGTGIPQEDLKRIFEPFYTKKAMGRSGTGLGLSVVWNTMQTHKGYINVQSQESVGTIFELYFPITEEAIEQQADIPIDQYRGNNEKILVVDDIAYMRIVTSKILESLGYDVATVSSGEEAIEYIKQNPVDLIILDMIMDPGIDGCETYQRIVEIRPTKAIIVSGYSETDRVRKAKELGAGQFLQKPYRLQDIGLAVYTELHK